MDSKRLNELWTLLHEKETEMFGIKAGEYASGDERLWNFKEGAKMMIWKFCGWTLRLLMTACISSRRR